MSLSWLDFIIVLAYIGVIISVVFDLRSRFFPRPGENQKHLSSMERENLVRTRKVIRDIGPLMIILAALSYVMLWYLGRKPPLEYIYLWILVAVYMILSYFNISPTLRRYCTLPQVEMPEKGKEPKYDIKMDKRMLYVNAAVLLVFCILYAQLRSAPFYGIWGIIAWAGTLFFSYTPILWVREEYKGWGVPREKRIFAFSIVLSWILVFFWLELGLGLS
jgi:hypothetical protein